MILEGKEEISNKLKNFWVENKASLEASVEKVSSEILAKVSRFQELSIQYKKQKLEAANQKDPDLINKMKEEIKTLHRDIKEDWKSWQKLLKNILSLKPTLASK